MSLLFNIEDHENLGLQTSKTTGRARIMSKISNQKNCDHKIDFKTIELYLKNKPTNLNPCPLCLIESNSRQSQLNILNKMFKTSGLVFMIGPNVKQIKVEEEGEGEKEGKQEVPSQSVMPLTEMIQLENCEVIKLPKGEESSILYCEKLPEELSADPQTFEELWSLMPLEKQPVTVRNKTFYPERRFQSYGRNYHFSGEGHAPSMDIHPFIQKLLNWVNAFTGKNYQQILVNWYPDGSAGIGLHADSTTQLVENSDIFSFSYGATRKFRVVHKKGSEIYSRIFELPDNSLVIMQKQMQTHYKHEVVKDPKVKERRINITFRLFKENL